MELTGQGQCHGSFGELLQGVLPGNKKFLINLKSRDISRARIRLTPSSYSNEKEALFAESYRKYSKSYKVVRNILVDIGRHDDFHLEIESDIPIGKGCSSSTADMVASVEALAASLSLALKPEYIASMLTEIEPNDGLHRPGTSVYHHTSGELIARFDFVPPLRILGIDFGGVVDTVEFNRIPFVWSDAEMVHYASLLDAALQSLERQDIAALCRIATESTLLWQKVSPKRHLDNVLQLMRETGGIGVVNTHSGTYLGVVYEADKPASSQWCDLMRQAEIAIPDAAFRVFETITCAPAPAPQVQP